MPHPRSLLPCALVALLLASLSAQEPYTNPVIPRPGQHPEVPDPFVLKWNGEYYLYTSGDPITAYHSTDLVRWTFIGPVLGSSNAPDAWNQTDIWAPEVVYRNGRFYMYYSGTKKSDDWRTGEWARRIGVAVSDSPRGPFVDSGAPVTPGWGIDGHVFRHPETGEEFLFYSYIYEPRLPGAGIVVDRLLEPHRVAGQPSHVTRGDHAWQDKDGNPENGSLRWTNEGPSVVERDGRFYMFYSGGSWDLPSYSLAYADAPVMLRGGLDGPGWTTHVPPILRATPIVDAPGHNSIARAPNNVDDMNVYHARVVPFLEPWNRRPFVNRVHWHHDRPFVEQPTTGLQSPPDWPLVRDLFDRADGAPDPRWQLRNGSWSVVTGALRAATKGGGEALAMLDADPLAHFVLEANVRLAGDCAADRAPVPGFTGSAGVVVEGAQGITRVLIDGARGVLALHPPSTDEAPHHVALPDGFRCDAWHQLLVTRNARALVVSLDGVRRLRATMTGEPLRAGLVTTGGAEFDGIALTAFYEDFFNEPAPDGWRHGGGLWLVQEGAMHQYAGGAGRAWSLKGQPADRYEFSGTVRWNEQDSSTASAGIVAAADEGRRTFVFAGFTRDIWPASRFVVRHVVDDTVQATHAVGLPRGFLYDAHHTIRVLRQGDAFSFFLDGAPMIDVRLPIGAGVTGFYTEGARAAFDDARWKQLGVEHNLLLAGGFETEQWDGGKAAQGNPWRLAGSAREHYCCAHSGLRRLLTIGGPGEATQDVSLQPGSYVLHAFVTSVGPTPARVGVRAGSRTLGTEEIATERWRRVTVPFEVPAAGAVSIVLSASPAAGSEALAAFDDVYLTRR